MINANETNGHYNDVGVGGRGEGRKDTVNHDLLLYSKHSLILHGFTLIELLVVIAIISILATILLPSLENARQLARQVVCQNKVKNLGVGMAMYLSDHSGQFPYHYFSEPVNVALNSYIPYSDNPAKYWIAGENWTCPERPSLGGPMYGANPGFSRGNVNTNAWDGWGRICFSDIPSPGETIWIIEGGWRGIPGTYVSGANSYYTSTSDHFTYKSTVKGNWESVVWGPPWGPSPIHYPQVSLRHNLRANATFADGHVELLDYEALQDRHKWLLPR